jgi:hypothetical protein
MMHYLGQSIELMQENSGWVGVWWHSAGYRIEMGFFATAAEAWDAMTELIQRDLAVRALLEVVEEWREMTRISEREYAVTAEALVQSVIA